MTVMAILRKINIFVILFSIFFNVNSYSEVVNKVDVQGNDRISSETIMIFGDIVIGNNYEESDVSLLIKKLYETRFFSNISAELANNKLTIVVEENPIVYSIIFKGEKAKKHVEKIKEFLLVREKSSYVSNNIKHDINQIKSFYRARGYYFVKIDAEIEKLEKLKSFSNLISKKGNTNVKIVVKNNSKNLIFELSEKRKISPEILKSLKNKLYLKKINI